MKQLVLYDPDTGDVLGVITRKTGVSVQDATGTFLGKVLHDASVALVAGDTIITNSVASTKPGRPPRVYRTQVLLVENGIATLERAVAQEETTLSFKVERHGGDPSFSEAEKTAAKDAAKAGSGVAAVACLVAVGDTTLCARAYRVNNQKKLEKREEFSYE